MGGDITYKLGFYSILKLAAISVLSTVKCSKDKDCVKFGAQFDIPLQSKNIRNDCALPDGRRVCCAAVLSNSTYRDDHTIPSRGVGYTHYPVRLPRSSSAKSKVKSSCSLTKTYIGSPQEERDFSMSLQLDRIADPDIRLDALLKYITSEEMLTNSTKWLERVSLHMRSEVVPQGNSIDKEFLSRFHITRKCVADNGTEQSIEFAEWDEWIEPVNIAARHPFAFSRCRPSSKYFRGKPNTGFDRSDVDYVLLQSGVAIADQTYVPGKRIRPKVEENRHYLLDAGTSTFDSSLSWFTCGYSQRGISFNQVFGWEMTLLDPKEYWRKIPAKWSPYWHFYNTPISADPMHADSPVRLIKQIATPGDFVSFKLDIDHSDTEMPVAFSLLQDDALAAIVDEFFFELHFQCEVMTQCGWGKHVPFENYGMKLDRPHVLQFFIDLRKKGIRAHIWP